jgi:hypothetical protein
VDTSVNEREEQIVREPLTQFKAGVSLKKRQSPPLAKGGIGRRNKIRVRLHG